MNDLIIKVSKRSRLIDLDHSTLGIVGENLQEKLIFTFQDEFVDGMARLEYELDTEKHYVLMEKVGQSYILPVQNILLTKEGNIDLQLVITEDETGTPVFKSEVFTLYCKKSIEAVEEAPSSYELWIEKANRILLEASRVNIDGQKTGNETVITITQRDGNKKSFPILDGKDGQNGQDGNGIVSIEKTSTSGLIDTYTITFSDGTTTTYTVTNGETPDLSDYVKNTDYATTSKGGVIKTSSTYSTNVSSSGNLVGMTKNFEDYTSGNNNMFVSKGTLENAITGKQLVNQTTLEASQATQDETIEGLQAELDRYKLLENALPHTENETASDYVTLENTAKSPMEIETIPQTSQETTTGKNLLKITNLTSSSGGIVPTLNSDGSISYSGTANDTTSFLTNYASCDLGAGNYTFSRYKSLDYRTRLQVKYEDETTQSFNINSSYNYTNITFSQRVVSYRLSINDLIINNEYNDTLFLQLETGSVSTDFEPYTGGIPAPNPDYPQDIHCTTGDNNIKVVGKNLFNPEMLLDTTNYNSYSQYFSYYELPSNYKTTFTVSMILKGTSQNLVFGFTDQTLNFYGNYRVLNGGTLSSPKTYDFSEATKVYFFVGNANNLNLSRDSQLLYNNYNIQLENGSSATTFTPYEETTYPISLGSKEMFNINNVSDGFVYDENEDKFYINRKNGKTTLDTTGWTRSAYNNIYYFFKAKPTNCKSAVLCLSNYFIYNASYTNVDNSLYVGTNNLIIGRPIVNGSYIEELSDFTNWLGSHNTIVVYQLTNSTIEEITDTTLISQLRAIKNALSMQGATHIISTASGSNLPFLIKARAVQTIERT